MINTGMFGGIFLTSPSVRRMAWLVISNSYALKDCLVSGSWRISSQILGSSDEKCLMYGPRKILCRRLAVTHATSLATFGNRNRRNLIAGLERINPLTRSGCALARRNA